jgi:divalent metal cation (Fe/Co/Zn/Cd) transporter
LSFRTLVAINLVIYTIICFRALSLESLAAGWQSITQNPWSWTTFIDSFGGVLFGIFYVVAREWGDGLSILGWVVGLLLLGNGVGVSRHSFEVLASSLRIRSIEICKKDGALC